MMTTNTPEPRTIRAHVDNDAIKRVSRFFNATTRQTIDELFQNARRAGASHVDVHISNDGVTVTDDGCGAADPSSLLAFGRTGWDNDTVRREDAAGMGVFSLARYSETVIESRPRPAENGNGASPAPGYRVRLTPEHFLGKMAAPVEIIDDDQVPFGTTVRFSHNLHRQSREAKNTDIRLQNEKELIWIIKQKTMAVAEAAQYFPLPVRVNGRSLPGADFLKQAVYTREWNGLRIGVRMASRSKMLGRNVERGFKMAMCRMNFHGIMATLEMPEVPALDRYWFVGIDVVNCPSLELVLPARETIVEGPFVDKLRTVCRETIYKAMAAHESLVEVPKQVHDDAADIGINLPVPAPRLQNWEPEYPYEFSRKNRPHRPRETPPADALIVDEDIPVCDQHTLDRAAVRTGLKARLCNRDKRLEGYPWYNAMPRITKIDTTVTTDGKRQTLEKLRTAAAEDVHPSEWRPDTITLNLTITSADGEKTSLEIPADAVFLTESDYCWPESLEILITKTSRITSAEVAELIQNAYFDCSEDSDDDFKSQWDGHWNAACSKADKLLLTAEEATISKISRAAETHLEYLIPKDAKVTIGLERGRAPQIELKRK